MRRALGLALASLLLVSGCTGDAASAWAESVADAQARADDARAAGRTGDARDALQELVHRPVPAGVAPDDARVVRQDAYAQLAELALHDGDPYDARRLATRGLALGDRGDVFATNLRIARARALEALGDAEAATDDYHRALVATERRLDEARRQRHDEGR